LVRNSPALAVLDDTAGGDVGVQHFGERVVARHLVFLAAFLMQMKLPAGALRPEISTFSFNAAPTRAKE